MPAQQEIPSVSAEQAAAAYQRGQDLMRAEANRRHAADEATAASVNAAR
ncbi:hypothetical protein [Streptomyces sp. NPDC048332]